MIDRNEFVCSIFVKPARSINFITSELRGCERSGVEFSEIYGQQFKESKDMATIDQFKANLIGGGPRANRFKVFIPRTETK